MYNFFSELFNSNPFMPHGQCFLWYPEILWLHVISDLIITLAYFSIPLVIFYIVKKTKVSLPFRWVYVMFGGFILLCGMTHMLAIIVLWDPLYRLEGLTKAVTAFVSIVTAFLIIPIMPQLIIALHNKEKNNNHD